MVESHQQSERQKNAGRESIWVLIIFGAVVLGIVLGIRAYIAKPFIVSGLSMYPTFNSWHYLIIDEYTYNFDREPQRGEVVVFRYPADPKRHFIKRVIGLPGETVHIDGTTVAITSEEETITLDEPYILPEKQQDSTITLTLNEDEYFVLGDNRKNSADSRYFGPLDEELIIGRALVRLFPFTQIDWLPGEAAYAETTQ